MGTDKYSIIAAFNGHYVFTRSDQSLSLARLNDIRSVFQRERGLIAMQEQPTISGYRYTSSRHSHAHAYLLPTVRAELSLKKESLGKQPARLFDLGCGNGSVAAQLAGGGGDGPSPASILLSRGLHKPGKPSPNCAWRRARPMTISRRNMAAFRSL